MLINRIPLAAAIVSSFLSTHSLAGTPQTYLPRATPYTGTELMYCSPAPNVDNSCSVAGMLASPTITSPVINGTITGSALTPYITAYLAGNVSISGVPFTAAITPTNNFGAAPFPGILLPTGNPLYISGKPLSASEDRPSGTLYVAKDTTGYTGAAPTGTLSAIHGFNNVGDNINSPQTGVLGESYNGGTHNSQPGGSAGAVGTYGAAYCGVAGCTATWGGVIAAYDVSGQSNPTNPLIGLEVDNYAHGTDSGLNRVGIQIAAGVPTAGTINTVGHGILMAADGTTGQFTNMIDGTSSHTQNIMTFGNVTCTGIAFNSPSYQLDCRGNMIANSVQLIAHTVATLPTCGSALYGTVMFVNDISNSITYRGTPAGGGSQAANVLCASGSTWVFQ